MRTKINVSSSLFVRYLKMLPLKLLGSDALVPRKSNVKLSSGKSLVINLTPAITLAPSSQLVVRPRYGKLGAKLGIFEYFSLVLANRTKMNERVHIASLPVVEKHLPPRSMSHSHRSIFILATGKERQSKKSSTSLVKHFELCTPRILSQLERWPAICWRRRERIMKKSLRYRRDYSWGW